MTTTYTYTIKYYNQTRNARTPAGAIRAAKAMERLYGAGQLAAVIDCRDDAAADDMVEAFALAGRTYGLRVAGHTVM